MPNLNLTDYIATEMFVTPDAELTVMVSQIIVLHTNLNPS